MNKIVIIGSGPAGLTAAIYAARAMMQPILIAGMQPGGQLTITTDVENYPGFAEVIQGPWLMEQMQKQAEHVGTIFKHDYVNNVDFEGKVKKIYCESGEVIETKAVIIATGAAAKWLGLPSEQKFQGFGVSACATCDGFFYKNKIVAVVGGGNTAVEEALYLTNFASKVYLIHRKNTLRAEQVLQKRLFDSPKVEVIWNHTLDEVHGSENPLSVNRISLKDVSTNAIKQIDVDGIFIAIGHKPSTDVFQGHLDMDDEGYIKVQAGTTYTNIEGVFAAGDVSDKIYRQAVTAAGLGCMAALDAQKYLMEHD